jgi:hypothetical protein
MMTWLRRQRRQTWPIGEDSGVLARAIGRDALFEAPQRAGWANSRPAMQRWRERACNISGAGQRLLATVSCLLRIRASLVLLNR